MASNHQTEAASSSYGGQSNQPFDFDLEVDPDIADGEYVLEISAAKARYSNAKPNEPQYPQIIVEWKAMTTEDDGEACQRSIGMTTSEFLTLRPKGDRKGNMAKQRLVVLRNRWSIDSDVFPAQLSSPDDLQPLCDVLVGMQTRGIVSNKKDDSGAWRSNIKVINEGGGASEEVVEEEVAAAPVKAKAAAAKAPAKGVKTGTASKRK